MKVFRLYGTSACHLCELAAEMIASHGTTVAGVTCEEVDISESEVLFERYGLRIPVLQDPDKREMDWPFTPSQVQDFMAS